SLLCRLEVRAPSSHGQPFARVEPPDKPATHGCVVTVHHDDRDVSQYLVEVGRRVEQTVEHRRDAEQGNHPRIVSYQSERLERGAADGPHSSPRWPVSRRSTGRRDNARPRATTIVTTSARSGPPAVSGAPTVIPARTRAKACDSGSVSAQMRAPSGMAL